MNKFAGGWYVIYTKPRHERKVSSALTNEEIDFYMPTRKILREWHDRKKYVDAPIFQSYIFVRLKDLRDYYNGLKIEGALHYVRFGKEIARVPDKTIEEMRFLVEYGKDLEVSTDYFQSGRQLFISQGPFTGISCEVVEVSNKQKILVRIHLLQRNLLVSLPTEYLIAISA
jgi:transcriptional antiterminator RfaH